MATLKLAFALERPSSTTPVTDSSEIDDSLIGKSQHDINAELYAKAAETRPVPDASDISDSAIGKTQHAINEELYAKAAEIKPTPIPDTSEINDKVYGKSQHDINKDLYARSAGSTHCFLTESAFDALTASTAEEGVIYIKLEGYKESTPSTAWVLGNSLPIILSGSEQSTWALGDNLPMTLYGNSAVTPNWALGDNLPITLYQ